MNNKLLQRPNIKDYIGQFGESEYEIDMENYICSLEIKNGILIDIFETVKNNLSNNCECCRFNKQELLFF